MIFGGEVVAEIAASDADEAALLRAAYNLKADAVIPEIVAAEVVAAAGAEAGPVGPTTNRRRVPPVTAVSQPMARAAPGALDRPGQRWALGLVGFLVLVLVFTKLIQPSYGVTGIQGLAVSVLPLALASVAQAIVVISGGIDLSIGSMMALTSVVAASQMKGQSEELGVAVVVGVILLGLLLGAVNGGVIVLTRVPDIVVTLAMSFVWAGCALLVLRTPVAARRWLKELTRASSASSGSPSRPSS